MQTKTYFASSVPAALEVARRELGEDALLVSSRRSPPLARQFGRLEVTFAWDSVGEAADCTRPRDCGNEWNPPGVGCPASRRWNTA